MNKVSLRQTCFTLLKAELQTYGGPDLQTTSTNH